MYQINQERLMRYIFDLAKVGEIEGGGCCRLALTEADKQGRDLVVQWMHDLHLDVEIDAIGNVGGGNGGNGGSVTAQTLSVTYTSGMANQLLTISGGNTVVIRTPLKTTALTPANASVGAVSTRVYGNRDGTLGRPDAWIQIDGTNLVLPAFAGL